LWKTLGSASSDGGAQADGKSAGFRPERWGTTADFRAGKKQKKEKKKKKKPPIFSRGGPQAPPVGRCFFGLRGACKPNSGPPRFGEIEKKKKKKNIFFTPPGPHHHWGGTSVSRSLAVGGAMGLVTVALPRGSAPPRWRQAERPNPAVRVFDSARAGNSGKLKSAGESSRFATSIRRGR